MDLFNLDFSLIDSSINDNVDHVELINKCHDSISKVLESVFDKISKKEIVKHKNRFNFACPYCGDSRNNPNKKRGNLYIDNFFYKCYNTGCVCDSVPFVKFIEDFKLNEHYTPSELFFLNTNRGNGSNFDMSGGARNFTSHLKNIVDSALDRKYIMQLIGAIEIYDSKRGMDYIRQRKQVLVDPNLFAYIEKTGDLAMLNIDKTGEKTIGLQIRHQYARRGEQRFTTYNYSKLVKDVLKLDEPDQNNMDIMDRYGQLYNILRIDMSKDVFILEGPIDANHINNAIATMSASAMAYFSNGHYIYDNSTMDAAGLKMSLEMIDKGYKTFTWNKFIGDYPKFEFCKDINDIMKKEDGFPINEIIKNYFSSDKLDTFYV